MTDYNEERYGARIGFDPVQSATGTAVDISEITRIQPTKITEATIDKDRVIAGLLALELWREWFEKVGNPEGDRGFCEFCGVDMHPSHSEFKGHYDNCIYIRAKELIDQDEKWRRFREEMQPVVKEAADGFSR